MSDVTGGGLDQLRLDLSASMVGADSPLAAADLLCVACVRLLGVDGASVSLMYEGASRGTFGSSGVLSRHLDELQFTFGEGPCMDAVSKGAPMLVADLDDPAEARWPSFGAAALEAGMCAVFALPVSVASSPVGALDLFRAQRGAMSPDALLGALAAADLAALPLLDLMAAQVDWDSAAQGDGGWEQLASLERTEVYQATGMIVAALDVGPVEALVRLRGYAFGHSLTASEVAWAIVERRLRLDSEDWRRDPGHEEA
jgi:hypothetical protein